MLILTNIALYPFRLTADQIVWWGFVATVVAAACAMWGGIAATNQSTKVVRSRFEIEQDGQISYLEFETDGRGWMTIWHTEVAETQRGKGLGLELVTKAFQYARDNNLRVDVICPLADHLLKKHPQLRGA